MAKGELQYEGQPLNSSDACFFIRWKSKCPQSFIELSIGTLIDGSFFYCFLWGTAFKLFKVKGSHKIAI